MPEKLNLLDLKSSPSITTQLALQWQTTLGFSDMCQSEKGWSQECHFHVSIQLKIVQFTWLCIKLRSDTNWLCKLSLAGHTSLNERNMELPRPGEIQKVFLLRSRENPILPSLARLEVACWVCFVFFLIEQALVFLYSNSDTWTFCTMLLTSPRERSGLAWLVLHHRSNRTSPDLAPNHQIMQMYP